MKNFLAASLLALLIGSASAKEVERNQMASRDDNRPQTAVVVTRCSFVVAVFITTHEGKLIRYTDEKDVPSEVAVTEASKADYVVQMNLPCEGTNT